MRSAPVELGLIIISTKSIPCAAAAAFEGEHRGVSADRRPLAGVFCCQAKRNQSAVGSDVRDRRRKRIETAVECRLADDKVCPPTVIVSVRAPAVFAATLNETAPVPVPPALPLKVTRGISGVLRRRPAATAVVLTVKLWFAPPAAGTLTDDADNE